MHVHLGCMHNCPPLVGYMLLVGCAAAKDLHSGRSQAPHARLPWKPGAMRTGATGRVRTTLGSRLPGLYGAAPRWEPKRSVPKLKPGFRRSVPAPLPPDLMRSVPVQRVRGQVGLGRFERDSVPAAAGTETRACSVGWRPAASVSWLVCQLHWPARQPVRCVQQPGAVPLGGAFLAAWVTLLCLSGRLCTLRAVSGLWSDVQQLLHHPEEAQLELVPATLRRGERQASVCSQGALQSAPCGTSRPVSARIPRSAGRTLDGNGPWPSCLRRQAEHAASPAGPKRGASQRGRLGSGALVQQSHGPRQEEILSECSASSMPAGRALLPGTAATERPLERSLIPC